jgi:hypothetical protein
VGSLDPKDRAISFLESSSAFSGSDCSGGLGGASSVGSPENGRGRDEFESLDDGRCCQERVPDRESAVALFCPGLVGLVLRGAAGIGRDSSLPKRSRPTISLFSEGST